MPQHATTLPNPRPASTDASERAVRIRHGQSDWLVCEGQRDPVLGPGSPDWFSLDHEPRAVAVKTGHSRATWRVVLADRIVYAKVIDHGGVVDRLKQWTIGDATRREWRALREARARGVPVVRCLAVGVSTAEPRRSVLLTEGLPDVVGLPDAWQERAGSDDRPDCRSDARLLINATARLLAQAHERGFVHEDAHADNILICGDLPGELAAVYVDAHAPRVSRRPASIGRTVASLAQLDQYFHRRARRTQRLRFLHEYLTRRESMTALWGGRGVDRAFLARLARVTAIHARRLARQRDRRLRRGGKYFAMFSLDGGWWVTAALKLERRHVFPETGVPDRTQAQWCELLGPLLADALDGTGSTGDANQAGLVFDITRIGRFAERVAVRFFGSADRRMFEQCHRLRHRDVFAELILAYAEHRNGGFVDATALVRPVQRERQPVDGASHPIREP